MSDGTNQNSESGGDGTPAGGEGKKGGDQVSYDTYLKSVDAEKALRKQLKERDDRLAIIDGEKKTADEQQKLANNQHLEVIGDLKKQLEESNAKNLEFQKGFEDIRKTSIVTSALAQKGIQVDPKYAHLIDLDSIQIGADGKPIMASVNKVVDTFQKDHPALAKPLKGGMPGGQTSYNGSPAGPLSKEDWAKLPLAEQKLRWKDVKL